MSEYEGHKKARLKDGDLCCKGYFQDKTVHKRGDVRVTEEGIMAMAEFRRRKRKSMLLEGLQKSPGQRIEEAVELSEIAMEIYKRFQDKRILIYERYSHKSRNPA
jgi:hypothetical protein